jgi:hypothetical protein
MGRSVPSKAKRPLTPAPTAASPNAMFQYPAFMLPVTDYTPAHDARLGPGNFSSGECGVRAGVADGGLDV